LKTSAAPSCPVTVVIAGNPIEIPADELATLPDKIRQAAQAAEDERLAAEESSLVAGLVAGRNDTIPPIAPVEVWALKRAVDAEDNPYLVHPGSEEDGNPFIAFRSFEDAVESAVEHASRHNIKCHPVRIK
jgi:hypothetical protein